MESDLNNTARVAELQHPALRCAGRQINQVRPGLIKRLNPNRLEQCLPSPALKVAKEQRVRHYGRCRVDLGSHLAGGFLYMQVP